MWVNRYFPSRYWARRFWVDKQPAVPTTTGYIVLTIDGVQYAVLATRLTP